MEDPAIEGLQDVGQLAQQITKLAGDRKHGAACLLQRLGPTLEIRVAGIDLMSSRPE